MFLLLWQFCFGVSDAGVGVLLLFVYHLLKLLGGTFHQQYLEAFPKSLSAARKTILGDSALFYEYIVCPKCNAIYDYDKCIEKAADGSIISSKCQNVKFQNHQQHSQRLPCGATLLRTVKIGVSNKLKPYKIYAYNSLKNSVERLLKRPGFLEKCEKWRE